MEQQPPTPYKETRPWGNFIKFTENSTCTVKILTVNKGQAFSLQYHQHRDEFWHIISGKGWVIIGDEKKEITAGEDYFVPCKSLHRMEAVDEDIVFLEIGYGDFSENDIIRIEDKYNRVT